MNQQQSGQNLNQQHALAGRLSLPNSATGESVRNNAHDEPSMQMEHLLDNLCNGLGVKTMTLQQQPLNGLSIEDNSADHQQRHLALLAAQRSLGRPATTATPTRSDDNEDRNEISWLYSARHHSVAQQNNKLEKKRSYSYDEDSSTSPSRKEAATRGNLAAELCANKILKLNHDPNSIVDYKEQYLRNYDCASQSDKSRNLVRTISDLPVFVPIESFRVASYSINGEPYLCLPQLLQYVKLDFPMDDVISVFEEVITSFKNATPKQVLGFITASVLPPNAKDCPLIKRSDADRACLRLYDKCNEGRWNNIIDSCSNQKNLNKNSKNMWRESPEGSKSEPNKLEEEDVDFKMLEQKELLQLAETNENQPKSCLREEEEEEAAALRKSDKQAEHTSSGGSSTPPTSNCAVLETNCQSTIDSKSLVQLSDSDNADNKFASKEQQRKPHDDDTAQQSKTPLKDDLLVDEKDIDTETKRTNESTSPDQIPNKQLEEQKSTTNLATATSTAQKTNTLFESEAQNLILDLARVATSTLMIQVYHRCFGKCIGLYYPALMRNSESECIECSSCRKMLCPRRFIGHTHGVKETNICHWGFDSNNWRHYIRLSRKQTMNSLDDDELLVQFYTLQTAPDSPEEAQLNGRRKQREKDEIRDERRMVDLGASFLDADAVAARAGADQERFRMNSSTYRTAGEPSQLSATTRLKSSTKLNSNHLTNTKQTTSYSPEPGTSTAAELRGSTASSDNISAQLAHLLNPNMSSSSFQAHLMGGKSSQIVNSAIDGRQLFEAFPTLASSSAAGISSSFGQSLPTSSNLHQYESLLGLGSESNLSRAMSHLNSTSGGGGANSSGSINHFAQVTGALTSSQAQDIYTNFSLALMNKAYRPESTTNTTILSTARPPENLIIGIEYQRELFLTANMATYLSGLGFNPELARNIIDNTLDFVRKSKILL